MLTVSDGVSPSPKGGPEPARHPSKSATAGDSDSNIAVNKNYRPMKQWSDY